MTEYMITFYLYKNKEHRNDDDKKTTMTVKISECPWEWFRRQAWKEYAKEEWDGCIVTMVHEIVSEPEFEQPKIWGT